MGDSNLNIDIMAGLDLRGDLGMADKLGNGLSQVRHPIEAVHPIQTSEKNFQKNREMAQMAQLQKMQGIHAPIRLQMEKRLVSKAGHLACITTRSNVSADILNGTDGSIGFEDFLGQPENYEGMCLSNPHDVIEAALNPTSVSANVKKPLFETLLSSYHPTLIKSPSLFPLVVKKH